MVLRKVMIYILSFYLSKTVSSLSLQISTMEFTIRSCNLIILLLTDFEKHSTSLIITMQDQSRISTPEQPRLANNSFRIRGSNTLMEITYCHKTQNRYNIIFNHKTCTMLFWNTKPVKLDPSYEQINVEDLKKCNKYFGFSWTSFMFALM